MHLYRNAGLDHGEYNLRPEVLERIMRRYREITLFIPQFIPQIGLFIPACIPGSLVRIDKVIAAVRILVKPDIIENEELHLRSPIADVG
jgi:hypothetical protein